ncbi:MAG: hypothetical protein ICV87_06905 [Gemmatimonadetes bacterium]|nr:hypothetical protein [Gemmatimonadota bacterium]
MRSWREVLSSHPRASARELAGILALQQGEAPEGGVVLSPRAWDYLNEILFIADAAADMGQLQNQLWDVEARAANELWGTDLEAVYATSAVTQSSATYWEANYNHWVSLCSSDPYACTLTEAPDGSGGPRIQRVDGWKVLGADVVGCVGGFLRGAWAGCAIGAGVSSSSSIIAQL